jgi:hypothetical protein
MPESAFTIGRNRRSRWTGMGVHDGPESAINGFPVPCYPQCLQRAHENAALVDFDFTVFQDYIFDGIREALGNESAALDVFRLQDADPAQRRYS